MSEDERDKPIASCEANEVEAWYFPFYFRPANEDEPAFLFLEDHLYNMTVEERKLVGSLVRIDSEEDLRRLGLVPDHEGVYRL